MAAYAGFMTQVTCRLTANNRDQLQNPTLGNRVRATFTFYTRFVIIAVSVAEYPGLEKIGLVYCSRLAVGLGFVCCGLANITGDD